MADVLAVAAFVFLGILIGIFFALGYNTYVKRRRTAANVPSPYPAEVTTPNPSETAFLHLERESPSKDQSAENYARWQSLSQRERQTAELVAQGFSNAEAAHTMEIQRRTVDSYLRNVYSKLGVRTRVELVNFIRDLHD